MLERTRIEELAVEVLGEGRYYCLECGVGFDPAEIILTKNKVPPRCPHCWKELKKEGDSG